MLYAWDILLTSGRSILNPEKSVLKMEKGIITRCEVLFPAGCCGLVFIHIDDGLHQVWPKNPGYQLNGNGGIIVSTDEYPIKEPPLELQFYGWNTDDTYNHTVTVRIQLVPKREIVRLAISEALRFTKLTKPE